MTSVIYFSDGSIGYFLLLHDMNHVIFNMLIKNTQFNITGKYDFPIWLQDYVRKHN